MGHYSECFENMGYSPCAHDNYMYIKQLRKEKEAMQEEITVLKQDVKELKKSVLVLLLEMKGDDEE